MSTSSFLSANGNSKATTLNAHASDNFDAKLAETQALLQRAAAEFLPATQASSLGAEDVVITHLINSLQLDIPVFVLETGALHTETLALLERTEATSRAPIHVYRPVHESVIQFVQGQRAWITGLRQEQSTARADVPLQDDSEVATKNLSKFNPLAKWTWGDVWHYIATHHVDYNPLHDQFFPSVGCAPCTRAISLGEEFRAGRWWWESSDLKECGLHVKPHSER
jgi:phosphoadenosine phosphosulfate reductase